MCCKMAACYTYRGWTVRGVRRSWACRTSLWNGGGESLLPFTIFEMWEETGAHGGNSIDHKENRQTPPRRHPRSGSNLGLWDCEAVGLPAATLWNAHAWLIPKLVTSQELWTFGLFRIWRRHKCIELAAEYSFWLFTSIAVYVDLIFISNNPLCEAN